MKQVKTGGPLLSVLSDIKTNKKVLYNIDDWSSLPLIFNVLGSSCLVECEENCFDDIVSSFDFLSDKTVFVPNIKEVGSFSKTYHEEMFERASVLISSSLKNIKLFIVQEKALDKPLFYKEKTKPMEVSGGEESQKHLLEFLHNNNYCRSETVSSPGEYSVRGGVVDVFSFGSPFPFRVGFLGDKGGVLYFNVDTGSVVKESLSARVFPSPQKPLFSIKEKTKHIKIKARCFLNQIEIESFNNTGLSSLKKTRNFKSIDYSVYKNKKNKNVFYSPLLLSRGFELDGSFYLPSWFSGSGKIKQKKQIPIVGSLSVGDYYVHENYGVCQYRGSFSDSDSEQDKKGFVSLRFADGKINLSTSLLGQIYFYAPSGTECSLGSLNKRASWEKRRKKAEKQAQVFIKEVLSSYAQRESSLVFPYKKNDSLVALFLSEFSFLDTPDQALAWKEIREDLCSEKPMHRLLCGDVGFGKTEIAMRAVFLSFINNKQSVVLAPTTLLSQQLYFCFKERLSSFGCNVDQVSRLTKRNNQKISSFLSKKTSVLIGTHSVIKEEGVLSQSSLLIVDEEHRFGVKDKEKIVRFSPACNYLSMSATPIPRTLQLALSGVRNVSTLMTPPVERKKIITNIHSFSVKIIKNYFLKEINRGGQVYFVDNSVESLKKLFLYFQKDLPGVVFGFLYGGMKKNTIKETMGLFINKKINVLFSTTIIESGIDIAAANTIVINNSHLFGLSQLHQLRGRVGRSSQQSYACLLVPKNKKPTPDAVARLSSIKKHSSLGSGYNIALEDLQIRGAGTLFGYSQSGESVVGFDYYSKILSKIMRFGDFSINKPDPVVDFDNAHIPSSMIKDEAQRIFYYKKISDCLNIKSLKSLFNEMSSLFGAIPVETSLLFKCKKLSFVAERTPVVGISKKGNHFVITASSFSLKNPAAFLQKTSVFFNSKNVSYEVSSDSSFLKIKFSYVKEDSYILLEDFLTKTHD